MAAALASLKGSHLYPDGACCQLQTPDRSSSSVDEDTIIVGNGSNEIIELLGHAFLRPD